MIKNSIMVSVFSSLVTVLLSFMVFTCLTPIEDEQNEANQPHFARSSATDMLTQNTINSMKDSIGNILDRQQQLLEQNQALRQKIAHLESLDNYRTSQTQSQNNKKTQFNISAHMDMTQEKFDGTNENNRSGYFERVKEEFLLEQYDSAWASEMDSSLADVEQRLNTLDLGDISITYKDCRSSSCLVEFSHQDNTDQSVLSATLAAAGTSEIVLKHINVEGNDKTIVIYKR